jgi:four helix bundle protein
MKTPAQSFQDLVVWQQAHAFALKIYAVTSRFPKEELFCLTLQLRRAGLSIPANIAEGFQKRTPREKARYLNISQGSLDECRYYLILSHDLGYLNKIELWDMTNDVASLLSRYRSAILASDSRR